MIQLIGATETAKILADEQALLNDLCKYRKLLCLFQHDALICVRKT